jgi:D-sedoheptulose 7-phosphate isomerase
MKPRFDWQGYSARCACAAEMVGVDELQLLAEHLCRAYDRGSCVFLCGNGGSGSNASHICQDLGKSSTPPERIDDPSLPRLRIISLTDNIPYILAWANDNGYDRIFVEQLKNLAAQGDMLIALSGSGNSPNVLKAVDWANDHGLTTWGMTGFSGGKLQTLAQHAVHVPSDDMGIVECTHLLIFHWILVELRSHIDGDQLRAEPISEQETAAWND